MNNEEKILSMLEEMKALMEERIDGLHARLDGVDVQFNDLNRNIHIIKVMQSAESDTIELLKAGQAKLEAGLRGIRKDIKELHKSE